MQKRTGRWLWGKGQQLCGLLLIVIIIYIIKLNKVSRQVISDYQSPSISEDLPIPDESLSNQPQIEAQNAGQNSGPIREDLILDSTCQCRSLDQSRLRDLDQYRLCSDSSVARGPKQRVVAYTFFGRSDRIKEKYFTGIQENLDLISSQMPGYSMRLYHNLKKDSEDHKTLCRMFCENHVLDLCNPNDLVHNGTHLRLNINTGWRFAPLVDPLVDEMHSRDLDSVVTERELAAVEDWLKARKTFHLMRDHPAHGGPMMAGMFGARLDLLGGQGQDVRERVREATLRLFAARSANDQLLLKLFLFPLATESQDLVFHDSYRCKQWPEGDNFTRPFPTRRRVNDDQNFIGAKKGQKTNAMCPVECRPTNHRDWLSC